MRQAADLFQLGHGLQRVAGAKLGQVAAVEQLQELDDELDVADAAVAGLHVAGVAPPSRCVCCSMRRFRALMPLMSARLR